ncbi:MAG: hypothetical protein V3S08_10085 [Phycisphaerales bacterium]
MPDVSSSMRTLLGSPRRRIALALISLVILQASVCFPAASGLPGVGNYDTAYYYAVARNLADGRGAIDTVLWHFLGPPEPVVRPIGEPRFATTLPLTMFVALSWLVPAVLVPNGASADRLVLNTTPIQCILAVIAFDGPQAMRDVIDHYRPRYLLARMPVACVSSNRLLGQSHDRVE